MKTDVTMLLLIQTKHWVQLLHNKSPPIKNSCEAPAGSVELLSLSLACSNIRF